MGWRKAPALGAGRRCRCGRPGWKFVPCDARVVKRSLFGMTLDIDCRDCLAPTAAVRSAKAKDRDRPNRFENFARSQLVGNVALQISIHPSCGGYILEIEAAD